MRRRSTRHRRPTRATTGSTPTTAQRLAAARCSPPGRARELVGRELFRAEDRPGRRRRHGTCDRCRSSRRAAACPRHRARGHLPRRHARTPPAATTHAAPAARSAAPRRAAMHAFPRGAGAGSFLHGLLEWAGTQGFAQSPPRARADLRDTDRAALQRVSGWNAWIEPLRAGCRTGWHTASPCRRFRCTAPRPSVSPQLAKCRSRDGVLVRRAASRRRGARRARPAPHAGRRAAPPLAPAALNGMLKGFIDLVFEHEGRYFVADYKSNWLGPDDGDYTGAGDARRRAAATATNCSTCSTSSRCTGCCGAPARLRLRAPRRRRGLPVPARPCGARPGAALASGRRKALIDALDRPVRAASAMRRDATATGRHDVSHERPTRRLSSTPDLHSAPCVRCSADSSTRWAARRLAARARRRFAGFLRAKVPDADPLLILAAALASHQLGRGHACLDLRGAGRSPAWRCRCRPKARARTMLMPRTTSPSALLAGVDSPRWLAALTQPCASVGDGPGDTPARAARLAASTCAATGSTSIGARRPSTARARPTPAARATLSARALRHALDALFPPARPRRRRRRLAEDRLRARRAQRLQHHHRRPGTGKTTTVVQAAGGAAAPGAAAPAGDGDRAPAHPAGRAHRQGGGAAERVDRRRGRSAAAGRTGRCGTRARGDSRPRSTTRASPARQPRPDTRRFRHDARNPLRARRAGDRRGLDGRPRDDGRRARRAAAARAGWSCSATRTSSPRSRRVRCWASCAQRAEQATTRRHRDLAARPSPASASTRALGDAARHAARPGRGQAAQELSLQRRERHRPARRGGQRRRSRRRALQVLAPASSRRAGRCGCAARRTRRCAASSSTGRAPARRSRPRPVRLPPLPRDLLRAQPAPGSDQAAFDHGRARCSKPTPGSRCCARCDEVPRAWKG